MIPTEKLCPPGFLKVGGLWPPPKIMANRVRVGKFEPERTRRTAALSHIKNAWRVAEWRRGHG